MDPILIGYLESIGIPVGVIVILGGVYYVYKTRCKDSSCLIKGKNFRVEISPDDVEQSADRIREAIKYSPEMKHAVLARIKSDHELIHDLRKISDSHDTAIAPEEV